MILHEGPTSTKREDISLGNPPLEKGKTTDEETHL